MSIITIFRHHIFISAAWDLGIFNQSFWSTLHGRFFYYSVEPWFGQNFLGVHFSPILIFLIPYYAIYPHPETLLILQSFILALGALPLYHLAKDELDEWSALFLSLLYLIYPPLLGANLFDFHVEAFAPVTLFSTIYFFKKKNMGLYLFSLLLSLMSLEFIPFLTMSIALHELVTKRRNKTELEKAIPYVVLTMALSVMWLFLAFAVRYYLRGPETGTMSILTPILNEMGHPIRLLSFLVTDPHRKLLYVLLLLGPLLFTSLSSSYFILASPWLLVAFTLNYGPYFDIKNQYSLVILPFVFLSSMYGVKKLLQSNTLRKKHFTKLVFVCSLFFLIWSASEVQPRAFDIQRIEITHRVISLIPANASVLTLNNFFPHVSDRFDAWVLPPDYKEPFPQYYTGISIIRKNYTINFLRESSPDFVLLDLQKGMEVHNVELVVLELLTHRSYGIYASTEGILLLKRHYEGDPVIFTPLNATFNYKHLALLDGSTITDLTSESDKVLAHTTKNRNNFPFWAGPNVMMPPGEYEVAYRLKLVGNSQDISVITLDVAAYNATKTLVSTTVHVSDFKETNTWEEFTLNFRIELPTKLEFRGIETSNKVDLYLDYIHVIQVK